MLVKSVSSCGVYCVQKVFQAVVGIVCRARTQYTPQLETIFTNIAEHLTTYFY
jgi:hypothetical protein